MQYQRKNLSRAKYNPPPEKEKGILAKLCNKQETKELHLGQKNNNQIKQGKKRERV